MNIPNRIRTGKQNKKTPRDSWNLFLF